MRDDIVDLLLRIGVPASVKGMTYICDAIELFDTDPYYPEGKICSLYADIAARHDTTSSRVERAIRHAFETAIAKGNKEMVERYLDVVNTQNSNLLRTLHFRIKQERRKQEGNTNTVCTMENCAIKKQIYQEVMGSFSEEIGEILAKLMEIDR